MSEPVKQQFMSMTETATMLGLSRRTIERWVADEKLAVVRIGKTVRVPVAEVERLLNDSMMPEGS
jgi:excisionase family DNA binding protein